MNFQPPDRNPRNNNTQTNGSAYTKSLQNRSPLWRTASGSSEQPPTGLNNSINRKMAIGNQNFKSPVKNRIGNNSYPPRNNNYNHTHTISNNTLGLQHFNNGNRNRMGEGSFAPNLRSQNFNDNRKRMGDGNAGPTHYNKRQWTNNQFHQNPSNTKPYNSSSIQDKLKKYQTQPVQIANNPVNSGASGERENKPSYFKDSQEFEPADITVQVVNNAATTSLASDDESLVRFKMILNPQAQTAIRLLQQKRKDKQIISPLPVTPCATGISMHERFSNY